MPLHRQFLQCYVLGLLIVSSGSYAQDTIREHVWHAGSENCASDAAPAVEVYRQSERTWVLRQNKCDSFEAPFMYLLAGAERAVLIDTGASDASEIFPLYDSVRDRIGTLPLIVVHSHGHRDHTAADGQFLEREAVTLVTPQSDALRAYFEFERWPEDQAELTLGERTLLVLPTPGHQEEAISFYDPETGWLITGDTLYPGLIYVKHWGAYRQSIARLQALAANYSVSAIMGGHIEMARTGELYPIGTQYQPEEVPLPLPLAVLGQLNAALQESSEPREITLPGLVVKPMSGLQRGLSNMVRWFTQ